MSTEPEIQLQQFYLPYQWQNISQLLQLHTSQPEVLHPRQGTLSSLISQRQDLTSLQLGTSTIQNLLQKAKNLLYSMSQEFPCHAHMFQELLRLPKFRIPPGIPPLLNRLS